MPILLVILFLCIPLVAYPSLFAYSPPSDYERQMTRERLAREAALRAAQNAASAKNRDFMQDFMLTLLKRRAARSQ